MKWVRQTLYKGRDLHVTVSLPNQNGFPLDLPNMIEVSLTSYLGVNMLFYFYTRDS